MKIEAGSTGGLPLLALSGNLTLGGGDLELREAVRGLLADGQSTIVLDLAGVIRIDSAGIGELVACKMRARQQGGDVRLKHPSARVRETLVLTRLAEVFTFADDGPDSSPP